MNLSRAGIAVCIIVAGLFSFSTVAADTTCPAGAHPATATDVPLMTAAGIPNAAVGMCWNSTDAYVGQSDAQAKQDLKSMWCGNSAPQCSIDGSTYTSTIEGLDPKFSLCADKFMKQLRTQDPSACIRSAYRSVAHQACSCKKICGALSCPGLCAPPGNSYHQKGLAIDVNHPRLSKQQLWSIGSQSGLGNPTGLHTSDPDHMQVMNGGTTCSDIGYQPTDTDVFVPGPAQSNPYFNYAPSPMPSLPPQTFQSGPSIPASTLPATTPTPTPQPPLCSPQFSCSNNVMYYQTSSCTTQVYQNCTNGCAGNSCAIGTSTTPTINDAFTTTTSTVKTNTKPASSTSDILNSFINQVTFSPSTVATGTSIGVTLNADLSNSIAQITDPNSPIAYASGTISSVQPVGSQQTFTSTDLSNTALPANAPQQSSGLGKILNDLKSALIWAIGYLKNF